MSNDMIAIKANKLPAHLQKDAASVQNPFAAAVSVGGFPVVSIRGKVFHVQRGDERTLVEKDDGDPAASLEVIILAANPNKSKVYYAHGYEDGNAEKPDCYSNDGVAPASDAEDPQAKKCAACPHNQWGSRISENGAKGKACSDSMRLAIAPAGQINDPMLLRVPPASLKTLGSYGVQLAKRGVAPEHVITKVGFDHSVAHPQLTFKAVRFVDEDELALVESTKADEAELLGNITGAAEIDTGGSTEVGEEKVEKPAKKPATRKVAAPKKASVEVEDEPEAVPESAAETKSVDDFDDIDKALDNLDFDD